MTIFGKEKHRILNDIASDTSPLFHISDTIEHMRDVKFTKCFTDATLQMFAQRRI